MDWIDYREKLGIGFNDKQKEHFFITNIFNYLNNIEIFVSEKAYFEYCVKVGKEIKIDYFQGNHSKLVVDDLYKHSNNVRDFISRYIIFAHILEKEEKERDYKHDLISIIKSVLSSSHILFDVIEIENSQFVFPKGVEEFDKALVSDNILWLKNYPEAQKAWVKALREYSDLDQNNASEIADLFRKALERFFQEFFNSKKSLENLKSEYGLFLENHGVPKEISNDLEKLLNSYTSYNNNYAKHADKAEINVLEYIMYQTGNIIRLVITLNNK